ncbi:MAG: flagellin [Pseudomonadota bacterium]
MTGSINTNLSALVALRTLGTVQADLAATQKRVSTGYTVADGFDNGAIFAVAQTIRNSIAGITAVNSQLNGAQGLISVANASLTQVSDLLTQVRDIATRLADQSISSDTRAQLTVQYVNLIATINNNLVTATYQGTNLIGTSGAIGVIQDVLANSLTLQGQNSTVGTVITNLSVATATALTSAGTFLLQTFLTELNLVATSLNVIGSLNQRLANQVNYNSSVSDALTQGLGALVDANLPAESARLQSLQVKQQLSTQSLAIANQGPSVLLTLFR